MPTSETGAMMGTHFPPEKKGGGDEAGIIGGDGEDKWDESTVRKK